MRVNECVYSTLGDYLQVDKCRILRSNAFASYSVSNREKLLRRRFRCCNRLMERIVWAARNVTSGTNVSNRAERPSKTNPKSGRPSTSIDDDRVEKVLAVMRQNRRLTVQEVVEEVGICKSSCHLILTEKRKLRRVDARYVPRLLTRHSLSMNFWRRMRQLLFPSHHTLQIWSLRISSCSRSGNPHRKVADFRR